MSIFIFIVILLVLVLVHEFGHFFSAKKFGIRVDEFGFGFPPKLFGIKKGETEYTFNLLPIGGFVRIFGESLEENTPTAKAENKNDIDFKRSFISKPKWQQSIVLLAGVFANFILAWFLFSVGFMSGLPTSVGSERAGSKLENVSLVIVSVLPDSPADRAGLKIGDKIKTINNKNGSADEIDSETVRSFIAESKGESVGIGYTRGKNETIIEAKIIPLKKEQNEGFSIGIAMDQIGIAKLSFLPAFWEGMKLNLQVTKGTVLGLYTLILEGIQGKGSFAAVSGPVGMVGIVGDAYQFGFAYLLSFTALISINLAIINLLPFPALDGGRLLFILIEKIKGSKINPRIANTMNMVGFALLILLMFVITYHDIIKLF